MSETIWTIPDTVQQAKTWKEDEKEEEATCYKDIKKANA